MTHRATYTDNDWLQQLVNGDEAAFAALYNKYKASLTAFIVTFVKSPEMAEDLSQEVFVKIWESRAQLGEVASFKSWLFIVARNHTLNVLKKAAHEEAARAEIIRHAQELRNPIEDELLSKEYQQHLKRLLEALPVQTRTVFQLCRDQYKSYSEVAALLGISRNAVKKHMVRSMKAFRDLTSTYDIGYSVLLLFYLSFFI